MARTWVRENGKMYYGWDTLKTKTMWKVLGGSAAIIAVPFIAAGIVKLVEKLRKR
jgi:hypothetical protein